MGFTNFRAGDRASPLRTIRSCSGMLAGAAALAITALMPSTASAELQVSFIGGGAKGAWTRALTAMSECLRQNSDIRATVTPTQGGMDAFGKLQADKGDFGFTYQSVLFPA